MEQSYYIWSAAMQGWALHSGGYGSELKEAKTFSRHDALARCILHFRKSDMLLGLIPVAVDDMLFITEQTK